MKKHLQNNSKFDKVNIANLKLMNIGFRPYGNWNLWRVS